MQEWVTLLVWRVVACCAIRATCAVNSTPHMTTWRHQCACRMFARAHVKFLERLRLETVTSSNTSCCRADSALGSDIASDAMRIGVPRHNRVRKSSGRIVSRPDPVPPEPPGASRPPHRCGGPACPRYFAASRCCLAASDWQSSSLHVRSEPFNLSPRLRPVGFSPPGRRSDTPRKSGAITCRRPPCARARSPRKP